MPGVFDDLIPSKSTGSTSPFADLIPRPASTATATASVPIDDSFEGQLVGGETLSPEEEAQLERRQTMALEQEKERRRGERAGYAAEVALPGLETGTRRLTFGTVGPEGVSLERPLGPVSGAVETAGEVLGPATKATTDFAGELALSLAEDIGSGDIKRGAPRTRQAFIGYKPTRAEATGLAKLGEEAVTMVGKMAPAIIANRFGVPMHVAFGAQMGLDAYEQTHDPDYATRQAIVGGLLGKAGEVGEVIGEAAGIRVAAQTPVALEKATIEASKLAGRQVAMNTLMTAGQAPELLKDSNRIASTMVEQIALTLALDLPTLPAAIRNSIAKDSADRFVQSKEYKDYVDYIATRYSIPEAQRPQADAMAVAVVKAEQARATATAEALRQQQEQEGKVSENAVREQTTDQGVLRQEGTGQQQLGLQQVGQGNAESQGAATGTATPQGRAKTQRVIQAEADALARIDEGKKTIAALQSLIDSRKAREKPIGDLLKQIAEIRQDIADDEEFVGLGGRVKRGKKQPPPEQKPLPEAPEGKEIVWYGPQGQIEPPEFSRGGTKALIRPFGQPNAPAVEVNAKQIRQLTRTPRSKIVEEPAKSPELDLDAEERKAIDEAAKGNEASGLPSEVIVEEPKKQGDDPFSANRIAYVDAQGNIRINRAVFKDWLKTGVRPGQEQAAVSALLRHEAIHSIGRKTVSDEEFAGIFNGLTAAEKALLRKAYTGAASGTTPEGRTFTDAQLGHEYVRRAMERLMGGPVSERVGRIGLDRITQPVLDIIEKITAQVKRIIGTKGNKDLQDILDRMQSNIQRSNAGEPIESNPEAYYRRKAKPSGEGQEEMKMEEGGERISAEEAKIESRLNVTPRMIADKADEAMSSASPDFDKFTENIRKDFDLSRGEIREAWQDAVWRRAEAEIAAKVKEPEIRYGPSPKEQLLTEAKRLEDQAAALEAMPYQQRSGQAAIGGQFEMPLPESPEIVAARTKPEADRIREQAAQVRKQAENASDVGEKIYPKREYATRETYRQGERRPEARIADEAIKLIKQSEKGAPLNRKEVSPQDVRVGQPDAYIEFEPGETILGPELVKDAGINRTTKIVKMVSEGVAKKIERARPKDDYTKRLTAMLNIKTGEVQLVSTYQGDMVRLYDPRFSHKLERPNIDFNKLRKAAPEWQPIASVLLDEPVRNFRQKFSSREEFNDKFADRVKNEYENAQRANEALAKEGAPEGETRLSRPTGPQNKLPDLTETETNAVFDQLVDEVGQVDSRDDVDDFITSLKDKAEKGTLTSKDWTAINGLNKIFEAVKRSLTPEQANEALKLAEDQIFDVASQSRTSDQFTELAMGRFTGERKAPDVERRTEAQPAEEQAPYHEVAAERRAALEPTLATRRYEYAKIQEATRYDDKLREMADKQQKEEAAAQQAQLEYQQRLDRAVEIDPTIYGDISSAGTHDPEAFWRPNSPADRKLRGFIGSLRSGVYSWATSPFRASAEWMVDRLRRGAEVLTPYEQDIVEGLTGKMNQIISKSQGYLGDMNSRFGDDILKLAYSPFAPKWLNELQVIEKNGTAIRNAKEAIEGRLRAPDAKTQKYVDAGQEVNFLIGEILERVSPNFIANGGMASNWTPLMFDIVMSHSTNRGSDREKLIRGAARANNVSPSVVRRYFNQMRDILSQPGSSDARVSAVAQDFARQFPRVITDIWVGKGPLGHWEPVVHSTFADYFHHGIRRAAMIRAFRETYPRNSQAFSRDYELLRRTMPAPYQGLVDSVYRVIQGQPSESSVGQQAIAWAESTLRNIGRNLGPLRAAYEVASPIMRALMLTRQLILQPAELVSGANSIFFGYNSALTNAFARFAKVKQPGDIPGISDMRNLLTRAGMDYAELEQRGIVDRMMYNDSFDPRAPARSVARITSNLIRRVAVENALNEMQEAQNGMAAAVKARRIMDANNGGPALERGEARDLRKVFEYMGFSRNEVERMMNGDADLLNQMQRKAASWLSAGHKHAAERSRFLTNRTVQKLLWFQDYPAARTNQLIKITDVMLKDMEAGRWREAANGAAFMTKFLFGLGAQGAIQLGLLTLFGAGVYGLKIKAHQLLDEPFHFTFDAMRSAIGGPAQTLTQGYEDRGMRGVLDGIKKAFTPTPYSVGEDLVNAVKGEGKYRDLPLSERLQRFVIGKTPGFDGLRSGIAVELLGDPKTINNAHMKQALKAFYTWRRANYGSSDSDSYLKDDVKAEFHAGMRKVKDGLLTGDEAKKREGFMQAAKGKVLELRQSEKRLKGTAADKIKEDIARSIETQVILKIETAPQTFRPMKHSEIEALKKNIGDDPVERLQAFDAMLRKVAQHVRPVHSR